MESSLCELLRLKYEPVAILWSDEKPEGALEFKPGKWGCVVWWFVSAAKGKIAVFSRETYGCWGGGVGLGFGNVYPDFPGGEDCFCRFLSTGNKNDPVGEQVSRRIQPYVTEEFLNDFLDGERYLSSPEVVKQFIATLPIMNIPYQYVIFKPLSRVDLSKEQPQVVVFLVNPNQLSALIVLAHYRGNGASRVIAPFSAGCQTLGIWAYERENEPLRAVIGLTDISARLNVAKQIGYGYLTIAFPWRMYVEIEKDAPQSFLNRPTWNALISKETY